MSKKGYLVFFVVILVLGGMIGYLNHSSQTTGSVDGPPPAMPEPKFNAAQIEKMWPVLVKESVSPPDGNPRAKWSVIEVGDFQCPNCGNARPLVEAAISSSNGLAKLYFINFPIPAIHPHALVAAEAGEAAAAQGKFWQMYDLLYGHQDELIDSEIEYNARSIPGIDVTRLTKDISSHKFLPAIAAQGQLMSTIGLVTVPTVLVRSPAGVVTWYCGTGGTNHTPGVEALAGTCPWGGGMGMRAATQIVQQEDQQEQQQEQETAPST